MQIPSEKQLSDWTLEASEYMEVSGRSKFPYEIQDELHSRGARRCNKCAEVKLVDEFTRASAVRNGLNRSCCQCTRELCNRSHETHRDSRLEYKRQYREENAELESARCRDYHLRHPWVRALGEGYLRADRAGLPAERIPEAQLLEFWASRGINPTECFYTGLELVPFVNRSLDHKVPLSESDSPGHVLENLVPADNRINGSKGSQAAVKYVIETASSRPTKKEIPA